MNDQNKQKNKVPGMVSEEFGQTKQTKLKTNKTKNKQN